MVATSNRFLSHGPWLSLALIEKIRQDLVGLCRRSAAGLLIILGSLFLMLLVEIRVHLCRAFFWFVCFFKICWFVDLCVWILVCRFVGANRYCSSFPSLRRFWRPYESKVRKPAGSSSPGRPMDSTRDHHGKAQHLQKNPWDFFIRNSPMIWDFNGKSSGFVFDCHVGLPGLGPRDCVEVKGIVNSSATPSYEGYISHVCRFSLNRFQGNFRSDTWWYLWAWRKAHGGFLNWGYPKWIVFKGKSCQNVWFGVPPISGNLHRNLQPPKTGAPEQPHIFSPPGFCWLPLEAQADRFAM